MPDALPAATLLIYPGLGQAPNMLACIPSGFLSVYYYYSADIHFTIPWRVDGWVDLGTAAMMLSSCSKPYATVGGCRDKHNCQEWNSVHSTLSHVVTRPLLPDDDVELVVNFALQHLYQVLVFVTSSSFCFFVSFFCDSIFSVTSRSWRYPELAVSKHSMPIVDVWRSVVRNGE